MSVSRLQPNKVSVPMKPYSSQGTKATGRTFVFVSGQVALDEQGRLVGEGDVRAQMRKAIDNLQAVLAEGGATVADVTKVTVYLTNIADFEKVADIRTEVFGQTRPASTTVVVSALARPEFLVEIEAYAVLV